MVLALSELLDRIRPVGAPGAPDEGERLRDADREAQEYVEIAALIRTFENEAEAVVAAARAEAGQHRRRADERIAEIRAGLPDRIATARATTLETEHQRSAEEQAQLSADTAVEIARIQECADTEVARLAQAAIELIWSLADAESSSEV